MNFSKTEYIAGILEKELNLSVTCVTDVLQPYIMINAEELTGICLYLSRTPGLYFDFLNCITCVDNGPDKGSMHLLYHISSLPLEHAVILKMSVGREEQQVPSLASLWRTADWHEREIFDLFGIGFRGHPDLRRILLPADWEGHPLRKDYTEQETYHGIKVKYDA